MNKSLYASMFIQMMSRELTALLTVRKYLEILYNNYAEIPMNSRAILKATGVLTAYQVSGFIYESTEVNQECLSRSCRLAFHTLAT